MADSLDRAIARLAEQQRGVFTVSQLRERGGDDADVRWRVRQGRWEIVEHDVLRLAGTHGSWRQSLAIACLAAGPEAAVSHRAAAALWQMEGFGAGTVEISTPRRRRWRPRNDTVVHTSLDISDVDITMLDGIRVTTPARTLIDVGAIRGVTTDRVQDALDSALRSGDVSLPFLRWRWEQLHMQGRRGCGVIRPLLEGRNAGPVPESRYERILVRAISAAGLPPPELQYRIRDHGRVLARVDAAYPDLRLAIEVDGHQGHSTRAQRRRDAERRNELEARGWHVLVFTSDDLWERREWVAARIADALRRYAVAA